MVVVRLWQQGLWVALKATAAAAAAERTGNVIARRQEAWVHPRGEFWRRAGTTPEVAGPRFTHSLRGGPLN